MISRDLLRYAFDQVEGSVSRAVEGLGEDDLAARLDEGANSIAWLVWHLTRVQDDHVAEVAGAEQVWTSGGWADRFALPLGAAETGYGASADDVAAVRASAELLTGYHAAVHAVTDAFLEGLSDADLDRVVDTSYDPPVTLGVRLVSVLSDDLEHVGQAAFVRGVLSRR